jgi:hypothetical protein
MAKRVIGDRLTPKQFAALGKKARDYGNPLIRCFAAEITGESYPFSEQMTKIRLESYSDELLGRKFVQWCDEKEPN